MISPVNPPEQHVAARLLDFFGRATPWHRSLWSVGSLLTLKEILEASEAARAGVLSPDALEQLVNAGLKQVGLDPGMGNAEQRRALQEVLKPKLRFEGLDYLVLRQITADLETQYLHRWAAAIASPQSPPGPERTARAIASHLLDAGFSPDFLHRWWTYKLRHEGGERQLSEVVAEAHQLVHESVKDFQVLIAFESIPRTESGFPAGWLTPPEVSQWLRAHGFEVRGVRQRGGVILRVRARDPVSATESATEILDKVAARVTVGASAELKHIGRAWIEGERQSYPLRPRVRGVRVRALHREDQIYSQAGPSIVDAAIELLAPLQSSSPSAAVAGGWAAIEALLSEPNDRGAAAERLASLVACSFPRAELTVLSYVLQREGSGITSRLSACGTNRDRAAAVVQAIQEGELLELSDESDRAALARMKSILRNPYDKLRDIQDHAAVAFRRLYRQRNIVLHWGKTDAVALRASLRTAAPLVGAGMDRIVHAWYVDGIPPLELAARARVALATIGADDPLRCIGLLASH